MRPFLIFLAFLPICASSAENIPRTRNLAYEDGFVWYLAGRLAHDLADFQVRSGVKLPSAQMSEYRDQYEILYHHYLVECGGPLPKIAESLRFFEFAPDDSPTRVLSYAGRMESTIWPIVREWNGKILLQLMDTLSKGKYGFFPPCIVAGFKDQNPIPGVTTR